MCGLAGWIGSVPDGDRQAIRMRSRLVHRGPDEQKIVEWPRAALVHTRLKIIDLTPAGAQPLANENGSIWVVFNGEIYNHRELRAQLIDRGHVFRGRSDSEVIPHLYEEWGAAFVEKLRGIFAIAVYDRRAERLLLARDRLGVKPLFYTAGVDRLAFASEIPPLADIPGACDRLDRQAIADYAALAYVPAPATLYAGIRALEPGDLLEACLDRGRVRWNVRPYHRWIVRPDCTLTLSEAVDRADGLVTAAVGRQLESDVPMAALLSGGIDSSLVCAAAQRTTTTPVDTFSARFSDPACDESWAADAVARHIGSRHEMVDISEGQGSWDSVWNLLAHPGQPFADPSLFGLNALSKTIRRRFTVALSGDGGDEAFGGYDVFWRIRRLAALQRVPTPVRAGAALGLSPLSRFGLAPGWFPDRLRSLPSSEAALVMSLVTPLPAAQHRMLCPDAEDLLPVSRLFEMPRSIDVPKGAGRIERLSAQVTAVHLGLVLPNDYLFKVDTFSMSEGLEIRVPMLDEDLVGFGLTLPHHLKVVGRMCKRVLRGVAARVLPGDVAAKRKQGFGFPMDGWATGAFKTALRETLLGRSTPLREIFRQETYRPWVEAFCGLRAEPGLSRSALLRVVMMLLALHVNLVATSDRAMVHG